MRDQWKDQRILIVGAARQGLAMARFASRHGAKVILNDKRSGKEMEEIIGSMKGYSVSWELGHHDLSLLDNTDLVLVSGGVPLNTSLIIEANNLGLPVSNDTQIFMESVPCRVIGITGSSGKTTTTTLVGRIAQAGFQPPRRVWVGGNIGLPLIESLDEIMPDDLVILEISSFQLELMTCSPNISAILNITPNHLDRHGTLENYSKIKARIFAFQVDQDITILGREDAGAWSLAKQVNGQLISFGHCHPPKGQPGTFFRNNMIHFFDGKIDLEILRRDIIKLRGKHNLMNILAACAIAHAADLPIEAMVEGVKGFLGVPHRLEYLPSTTGFDWYNDSKATTPEGSIAAINTFDEPLVLLLGGRDKQLPWDRLAKLVHERVDHVILFGEAAGKIESALGAIVPGEKPYTLTRCKKLEHAVQKAAEVAEPGDVILLSPGGTSFDEFNNYEERGERFKTWVNQIS
ncbi:MAG: UDP-N-acetylmuramoyl-L-alanine--D-glutamate ligase [Anaerolineaceae bacterium]|nr:UDP-N-acetylmuramoyl-L-alanine--D-glutamate ligase [Anaerolineaceae bacterium]